MNDWPASRVFAIVLACLVGAVLLLPMAVDTVLGLTLLWLVINGGYAGKIAFFPVADSVGLCVCVLLLYLGFSVFWSPEWTSRDAIQVWLRILLCLCGLVAIVTACHDPARFFQTFSRILAVCVIASVAISILLWLFPPGETSRLSGLFRLNNPGKAGRMYAAMLPVMLAAYSHETGRWRGWALLAAAMCLIAVVLTDTRSAMLGGLLGAVVLLVGRKVTSTARFLGAMLATCIAATGVFLIVSNYSSPELVSLVFPRGDSFRLLIWQEFTQTILDSSTWFGHGYLAEHFVESARGDIRGAHSMYLSTAFQAGVIGLLLFLSLALLIAIRLVRNLAFPLAPLGLSLLVAGMAMFVFNGDRLVDKVNIVWITLWLPAGIALALNRGAGTAPQPPRTGSRGASEPAAGRGPK